MTILENDLGKIDWPLVLSIGGCVLYLVDDTDPTLKPIWEGDPLLGWEGDERLRVYVCPRRVTWELVRLEANGSYSSLVRFVEGAFRLPEMVGQWVIWLVTHDGRRGFDMLAAQDAEEAKVEHDREQTFTEKLTEEIQPQLRSALHKDGVDEVWGGQW
jgi:hypothetical protein